jgi:predicted RNA-binding Zn-ribbon protein involved in translation (DUF1610 family)
MAVYHDQIRYALSLYRQLQEDLPGKKGDSRTPAKSLPPLWIDAAQLRIDMDSQTRSWCPKEQGIPQRLGNLSAKTWRPQDTDLVTEMARMVDMWCETILHLLDPESVKHISAPCPSCGRAFIYRRDSAGESVRQPALKVVTNVGASCQHCDAHWAPDRYMFLCRLLGFDLPEGVLE